MTKALALLIVVSALLTQATHLSPRDLLRVERSLTDQEIATILDATRQALTAKTFRLTSSRNTGPEILMGRGGRPRMARSAGAIEGGSVGPSRPDAGLPATTRWRRDYIKIIEYTDRPAADCTGSAGAGELVVEYERDLSSTRWTTRTRERDARDYGDLGIAPIFEMMQGHGAITSGERRRINGRSARALVSAWRRPPRASEPSFLRGEPIPNVPGLAARDQGDGWESLWIDSASLLPLRWEVSDHGSGAYGFDFVYRAIALGRPVGVQLPRCGR